MTSDNDDNDPLFAAVASLPTRDVDRRRADRLRRRCHASLQVGRQRAASPVVQDRRWLRGAIASGMAGAWCVIYILEIIRRAALIYGF